MSASAQFLSPSAAAQRLGVSAKALRLYERRGLVTPGRTAAGWRSYGPDEIARLYAFCGFEVDRSSIDETLKGFDRDLIDRASKSGPDDDEIHRLMTAQGVT